MHLKQDEGATVCSAAAWKKSWKSSGGWGRGRGWSCRCRQRQWLEPWRRKWGRRRGRGRRAAQVQRRRIEARVRTAEQVKSEEIRAAAVAIIVVIIINNTTTRTSARRSKASAAVRTVRTCSTMRSPPPAIFHICAIVLSPPFSTAIASSTKNVSIPSKYARAVTLAFSMSVRVKLNKAPLPPTRSCPGPHY